ncbi:hypothetical protein [Kamptonema sp. UHCC 0994]|uniref:hypothetical protein n=1 Tax=Kamptonema sp. UHCC 0994 TaxID=3031329 RepID=UPI0023B922E2|nr:hypothetical protein [Kamptonema sp. UHCC 0994]MDF0553183.1 hypothetical protein [Kamptonema sp. UHCC 0994]
MQTKDLPDLDKMTPAEIESAAKIARLDQLALERIWSIVSQASMEDKLAIASLALLYMRETLLQIRFSLDTNCSPILTEAARYLRRISDDEEKLGLAIAILEGAQTEREADAIVPPDCVFSEAAITEYITLRGLQQLR